MEIPIIWIVLAIVGAIVASNKGRSGAGWFFLCLVLTPVVILILLALPPLKAAAPQLVPLAEPYEEMKICPECAETVKLEARICRYCRHEFWHEPAAIGAGE